MLSTTTAAKPAATFCVLLFDESNLVALRRKSPEGPLAPTAEGPIADPEGATMGATPITTVRLADGGLCSLNFILLPEEGVRPEGAEWFSLDELRARVTADPAAVTPLLRDVLAAIGPHVIRIPYLNLGENDYIYRFRTEEQRNRAVYMPDAAARGIYQSALCEAIKLAKRQRERSAESPARLDFGAVRYLLPSHFGFCLGVQNAIERAYETIAANPGRRVFMISELIHNPFVNDDLRARGLLYLQSDRGVPFVNPATGRAYWDEIGRDDIVLTPAFGATDDDKVRLIGKGVAINRYDATCMLVEKVWKAGRRFAQGGFTVLIHGKDEHEETKATFSNCAKYGPSLVIRDRREAGILGRVILAPTREEKLALFQQLPGRRSAGFDVERDLERVAVVNQTTLLRNETLGIIDDLERVIAQKYGAEQTASRLHMKSRGDTLCYATQVNQDALARALDAGADAAIVVGGRNSSNTYQLFRICAQRFGDRAYYIQSEANILSRERIQHYVFPHQPGAPGGGETVERPFLPPERVTNAATPPLTVLITGGASCPDGIIQQVIARINGFFPAEILRPIEDVLAELGSARVAEEAVEPKDS
jgi:4-hydroxy-3-methylbut-2-enyl diphosphate reductase